VSRVAGMVAALVITASSLAALFLVAYILLVVFKASPHNDIVRGVRYVAIPLTWVFKNLFTPHSRKAEVAINSGLAAVVYLVVGRALAKLLRRAPV